MELIQPQLLLTSEGYNSHEEEGHVLDGEPKHCFPETQLICYDGNKRYSYRAMLARVGLDSPIRSFESGDSTTLSCDIQGMGCVQNTTPVCPKGANQSQPWQHGFSPRNGKIGKEKGNHPLVEDEEVLMSILS